MNKLSAGVHPPSAGKIENNTDKLPAMKAVNRESQSGHEYHVTTIPG